jgi:hypothetical protein
MAGTSNRNQAEPLTNGSRTSYSDDYEDLDPNDMVGCHTGEFAVLNLGNPQPGFEYVWESSNPRARVGISIRGGEVVTSDDPEYAALRKLSGASQGLDTATMFGDVVLVRYPVERVRQRREAEQSQALKQLRGTEADFVCRADNLERSLSPRRPSRFRRGDHHIEILGDNKVIEHWTPDKGIIEEA